MVSAQHVSAGDGDKARKDNRARGMALAAKVVAYLGLNLAYLERWLPREMARAISFCTAQLESNATTLAQVQHHRVVLRNRTAGLPSFGVDANKGITATPSEQCEQAVAGITEALQAFAAAGMSAAEHSNNTQTTHKQHSNNTLRHWALAGKAVNMSTCTVKRPHKVVVYVLGRDLARGHRDIKQDIVQGNKQWLMCRCVFELPSFWCARACVCVCVCVCVCGFDMRVSLFGNRL